MLAEEKERREKPESIYGTEKKSWVHGEVRRKARREDRGCDKRYRGDGKKQRL